MRTVRSKASMGSLNDRLLSELLSHSCGFNPEGTDMHFTVHLCCTSFNVEVHVEKGRKHFSETNGDYLFTDYTVTAFTIREADHKQ